MTVSLVTGGAGFIGSHLVEALVRRGDRVRVLDNLSTGRRDNLAAVWDHVELIENDLGDVDELTDLFAGVDRVFHQGALASVSLSVEQPLVSYAACATATLHVLEAARRAGVRRVVYASSSAVYGDQPYAANRETDPPAPLSPYAAAKLAGEAYCRAYFQTFGLETVALRYFNVFGPRQDPDSPYSAVIPIFISRLLAGRRPVVFGDGGQSRDFLFVGDIVAGNLLAAETPEAAGRVFNLAGGRSTSLNRLLELLGDELGIDPNPQYEPPRAGDIRDSLADISLARRVLGFEPQVSFAEGLRRSIAYYQAVVATPTCHS